MATAFNTGGYSHPAGFSLAGMAPYSNVSYNPNITGEALSKFMPFAVKNSNNDYSYGDADTFALNPVNRFIGVPMGEPYLSQYDKKHRTYQWPKSQDGKSTFLAEIVTGLVSLDDTSFIFDDVHGFPIKRTSQSHFHWDETKFDNPIMQIVPYEGVSRIVRASYEKDSATTVRYGIALYIEHEFLYTEMGLKHFYRSLQQLENAVRLTLELNVLIKMTSCRPREYIYEMERGYMSGLSYRDLVLLECKRAFSAQKSFDGLEAYAFDAINALKTRGIQARTIYAPANGGIYFRGGGDALRADINGPRAPDLRHRNPEGFSTLADLPVKYTREYHEKGEQTAFDPFMNNKVFGQYFRMFGLPSDMIDPAKYRTWMRDIIIYDADRDDFRNIDLRQVIENIPCWGERDAEGHTWLDGMQPDRDGSWTEDPASIEAFARGHLAPDVGNEVEYEANGYPFRGGRPGYPERMDERRAAKKAGESYPIEPFQNFMEADLFGTYVGQGLTRRRSFVRQFGDMKRDYLPMNLLITIGRTMTHRDIKLPSKKILQDPITFRQVNVTKNVQALAVYTADRYRNAGAYTARHLKYPIFFPAETRAAAEATGQMIDFDDEFVILADGVLDTLHDFLAMGLDFMPEVKEMQEFATEYDYANEQRGILTINEFRHLSLVYNKALNATTQTGKYRKLGPKIIELDDATVNGAPLGGHMTMAAQLKPLQDSQIRDAHLSHVNHFDGVGKKEDYIRVVKHVKDSPLRKNDQEDLKNLIRKVHEIRSTRKTELALEHHLYDPISEMSSILGPTEVTPTDKQSEEFYERFKGFLKTPMPSTQAKLKPQATTTTKTAAKQGGLSFPTEINQYETVSRDEIRSVATPASVKPQTGTKYNPFARQTPQHPLLDFEDNEVEEGPHHYDNYNTPEWKWRLEELERRNLPKEVVDNCIAVMQMPITKESLLYFVENDIECPIGFLIMRPWIQMSTASAVLGRFGLGTGFVVIGNSDMMFADDVSNKSHELHYTVHSATVITNKLAMYTLHDIWSRAYLGGSGAVWFNKETMNKMRDSGYKPYEARFAPSIYPLMTVYNDDRIDNVIDTRGKFHLVNVVEDRSPHYITTAPFVDMWDMGEDMGLNRPFEGCEQFTNTVCVQAQQWIYHPGRNTMEGEIIGRDVFGQYVYPTVVDIYNMQNSNNCHVDKTKKPVGYAISYTQTHD